MTFDPATATIVSLMAADIEALPPEDALHAISILVDLGGDASDAASLSKAVAALDHLQKRAHLAPGIDCRAHYCRANVWAWRRRMSGQAESWTWRSDEIDQELLELRRTVAHAAFLEIAPIARAQALTNLGNALNHIGRFVEAIEAWDRALAVAPNLAMANGNQGLGLIYYAGGLYDSGHRSLLVLAARHSLEVAGAPDALWESKGLEPARDHFAAKAAEIDRLFNIPAIAASFEPHNHSLGRSRREQAYRRWCLANRLFLNPLNDIGPIEIAAQDVMTLPTLVTPIEDGPGPPAVIRYFNVMKQEYASARFALFEGLSGKGVHFADRRVLLYNTLDYPAFGEGLERIKTAFRNAYALLDKVGFCLNVYLDLGHKERQVTFRNLWFETSKARALHPKFDGAANWPLRGLFWLSKDIFEDEFRQVTEPDARALYELRNHLEHKFVSVRDDSFMPLSLDEPVVPGVFPINASDLAARTLRQLKLARAALIYLAMGVFAEERRREAASGGGLRLEMPLTTWADAWKRRDY